MAHSIGWTVTVTRSVGEKGTVIYNTQSTCEDLFAVGLLLSTIVGGTDDGEEA